MSLRPRVRLSWALVASAALAVTLLPATAASAGSATKTSTFNTTIVALNGSNQSCPVVASGQRPPQNMNVATAGQPTTFCIYVQDDSTSSNSIGSAQVFVPASINGISFGGVSFGTISQPSGWVESDSLSGLACSSDSPGGCPAQTPGTLIQVNTPSNSGANKVAAGQYLVFSVIATPTRAGSAPWTVATKNSAAWSSGQLLTPDNTPSVTVAAPRLAFAPQLPPSITAGQSFGMAQSVQVQYADGTPLTLSGVTVTLACTVDSTSATCPMGGTTSATTDGSGTAPFPDTYLTLAGPSTITASATYGGVTFAPVSASTLVKAGLPFTVRTTGPSAPVMAGVPFSVTATVKDFFGNLVGNANVSLYLDCDPSTATCSAAQLKTTNDQGTATVSATLTDPLGRHSLVVGTDNGKLSSPVSFTLVPGPAYSLKINSVTDDAGLGVLSSNNPFTVEVYAYDKYKHQTTLSDSQVNGLTVTATYAGSTVTLTPTGVTSTAVGSYLVTGLTYSGYGNGITLTASSGQLVADTALVDFSRYVTSQNLTVGQSSSVSNGSCVASPGTPVCGTVILPNGAYPTQPVVLSQGACTGTTTTCLDPGAPVLVSVTADLGLVGNNNLYGTTTNKYGYTDPATAILQCDKSLCGSGGTNSYPITFQLNSGPAFAIPACPAKGTLGFGQTACQDYVQNHRDNAGDLIAYVLFLEDPKMNF